MFRKPSASSQGRARGLFLEWLRKQALEVDTRIVLQMQRIVAPRIEEIFVPLTASEMVGAREGLAALESVPPGLVEAPSGSVAASAVVARMASASFGERGSFLSGGPSRQGIGVAEVVVRSRRCVIQGDPGSGKSTVLKWLVNEFLDAKAGGAFPVGLLPVPVALRDFALWLLEDPGRGLGEYLSGPAWMRDFGEDAKDVGALIEQALGKARVVLLLDGLDEAMSADGRQRVSQAIGAVARPGSELRVVVTTRILGYESAPLPGDFEVWRLEPFGAEQCTEFIRKWCRLIERADDPAGDRAEPGPFFERRAARRAEDLLGSLGLTEATKGDPLTQPVRQLASNPMLATLIGLIHHQGRRLPADRAELYRLCIEAFVYDWEIRKRVRPADRAALAKDETFDVLEELAWRLHDGPTANSISEVELRELVARFLVEQKGIDRRRAEERALGQVELIRDRAGLLIARGEGVFGFAHLQFQEYLAGRALIRRRRDVPVLLRERAWQTRWREPVRLAAARSAEHSEEAATEFLGAVRGTPPPARYPEDFQLEGLLHHSLFLALSCLGDTRRVFFQCRQALLTEATAILEDRERFFLWRGVVGVLACVQPEQALAPLASALAEDLPAPVRSAAALALGELGLEAGEEHLLRRFLDDPDRDVRNAAGKALYQLHSDRAVQILLESLQEGQDSEHRSRAAVAAGILRAQVALGALCRILSGDEDSFLRYYAADSLGELGCQDAVEVLLRALKRDESGFVRMGAAFALGELGSVAAIEPLLESVSGDLDPSVRMGAAYALGDIGAASVLRPLLHALIHDDAGMVRRAAAIALSAHQTDTVVAGVVRVLESDLNSEAREGAALALGLLRNEAATELLVRNLARDPSPGVRAKAAQAVAFMRSKSVIAPLLEALARDEDMSVRSEAVRALGRLRAEAAVEPLVRILRDDTQRELWPACDGALRAIVIT